MNLVVWSRGGRILQEHLVTVWEESGLCSCVQRKWQSSQRPWFFPISSVTSVTVNGTLVTVLARKNKMLSAWQVMPLICEARAVGFFIFPSLFHHVMIIVKIEGFTCFVACRLHPGGPVERTSHNNGWPICRWGGNFSFTYLPCLNLPCFVVVCVCCLNQAGNVHA